MLAPPLRSASKITVIIVPIFLPTWVSPNLSPALPIVSKRPSSSSVFFGGLIPNISRSSSEITEIAP